MTPSRRRARRWRDTTDLNNCLSFGDEVEKVEELGEADGGRFCALNQRFAFGAERGYAEGHGDAVVAA
jgi:hypothetical protein